MPFVDEPVNSRHPWLRPELVAPWWEIALVTAVFVGPFIWRSNLAAWHGSAARYVDMLLSNSHLLQTGAIEAALLAVFLVVMHRRKWTPADFRVRPSLGSSVQGLALFGVVEVVHAVTILSLFLLVYALQTRYASFLQFALAQVPHLARHSLDLSWCVLIPVMILNAFMEELLCMGYFFTQVAAKVSPLAALMAMVMLRMAYHTYQGPLNAVSIGMIFLVFGLWYGRTRNLWVLIFAHATLDIFSTGAAKIIFGG